MHHGARTTQFLIPGAASTQVQRPLQPPHGPGEAGNPLLSDGAADGGPRPSAASPPRGDRVVMDPEAPSGQQLEEEKRAFRRERIGLCFNALSTVFGTGMSLFAKVSGHQGIGVFEIVLTRSLILVLFTGPELLYYKANPFADPQRRWLLVLRGVLGFCSISSLYLAVALLPLADASVLSFLSPIFVAALSPFILKERSPTGVLLGIPVAMVGVVLVAQPSFVFGGGGGISELGVTVGVAQACFNALARICVRALSQGSSERMASIIFGQGAISCLGAATLCAVTKNFKVPTEVGMWAPLLAGGLLGYFYQLALTAGLQRARAAPAVAMSYLSVIWGVIADIFVFHDLPDSLSLTGAGIICLSSLFVAFSQRRASSHKSADARWERSTARLQQEGEDGSELERRLLEPGDGRADGLAGEDADGGSTEWLSAEERSWAGSRPASAASSAWASGPKVQLKLDGRDGPPPAVEGLQPDTPAAPPLLGHAPGGQPSSSESLYLLGSSPDGPAGPGGAGGGRPPLPPPQ